MVVDGKASFDVAVAAAAGRVPAGGMPEVFAADAVLTGGQAFTLGRMAAFCRWGLDIAAACGSVRSHALMLSAVDPRDVLPILMRLAEERGELFDLHAVDADASFALVRDPGAGASELRQLIDIPDLDERLSGMRFASALRWCRGRLSDGRDLRASVLGWQALAEAEPGNPSASAHARLLYRAYTTVQHDAQVTHGR